MLIVLLYCGFGVFGCLGNKKNQRKQHQKTFLLLESCFCLLVWCCRLFCFFLFCLILVFVLIVVVVVVFVVVPAVVVIVVCCFVVSSCLGYRPKKAQQKKQNPLFYSFFFFFCAIVFRGLWPQKCQQPKGKKKKSKFSSVFSRKRFFQILQKEAFGFRVVVVFLWCLSFFSLLEFVAKF